MKLVRVSLFTGKQVLYEHWLEGRSHIMHSRKNTIFPFLGDSSFGDVSLKQNVWPSWTLLHMEKRWEIASFRTCVDILLHRGRWTPQNRWHHEQRTFWSSIWRFKPKSYCLPMALLNGQTAHTPKSVTKWLKDNKFDDLQWLTQSSDLRKFERGP